MSPYRMLLILRSTYVALKLLVLIADRAIPPRGGRAGEEVTHAQMQAALLVDELTRECQVVEVELGRK